MFSHIIEPGLELRLYEERQADEIYQTILANREHLRRFMPWVMKMEGPQSERDFIKRSLQQLVNNDGFQCGIWEHGRFVGGIGVHWIKWDLKYTEMGYWLTADAQGRGIMTKACSAIIDHAFGVWKLNKVQICCHPENVRSRAIPERLGFTNEGMLRQVIAGENDQLCDGIVYGLLTSEWKSKRI
ncbi:MAG TPA: GNAT family N-acetyltransferase [Tepidisphaeraceae bacterium]|jgi:ribosomal-protein-serine acetyltransferase|nr:GNAT family N-acetyltransferase [Tepidisphaeraceae bacterium]